MLDSYYLTCVPEAVTIEVSSSIAVSVVAVGRLFAGSVFFKLSVRSLIPLCLFSFIRKDT